MTCRNIFNAVVIALITGVIIFPKQTLGVWCYVCKKPECDKELHKYAEIIECATHCYWYDVEGLSVRTCGMNEKWSNCMEEEFPPDGCYRNSTENDIKLNNCKQHIMKTAQGRSDGNETFRFHCSCKSDLCNKGEYDETTEKDEHHDGAFKGNPMYILTILIVCGWTLIL